MRACKIKGEFFKKVFLAERGQALIEFALVIPLFMLLIMGIIEISWITYQRSSFEYGCSHAAWDITAEQLSDIDALKQSGSIKHYSGGAVDGIIKSTISGSTLLGFNSGGLNITNASATMYNQESKFSVPGANAEEVEASTVTRYMDVKANLSYDIKPITFLGNVFFGGLLKVNRDLDYTRVVGAQHRSE